MYTLSLCVHIGQIFNMKLQVSSVWLLAADSQRHSMLALVSLCAALVFGEHLRATFHWAVDQSVQQ